MDINSMILALGAFCAALVSVGGVAKWLIRGAMRDFSDEAEKIRVAADLAHVKRDGEIDQRFALLDQNLISQADALKAETKERHQWEADLERRKQHTKANHEQKMAALERRQDIKSALVEENTRRIIALEESHKNIERGQVRIEESIKAAAIATETQIKAMAAVSAQQFDQVCESIREISNRSPRA